VNPLSASYAHVARVRRAWYERRPHLQRQLGCPVISVGNLVVGGSGKTPVVAAIAELLRDAGHTPAILSRGYKRRSAGEGIVVVSDGTRVVADVSASGDEPQMLARQLPGVPVLVSADRFLSGTLARRRFDADVLILDDGYQHLQVARTVDLLLLRAADLDDAVVPSGRLREPIEAARRADAILVPDADGDPMRVARRVGVADAFTVCARFESLRAIGTAEGRPLQADVARQPEGRSLRVVAVAAIARPDRFFNALRSLGYDVTREIAFRDHHWFTRADIARIERAAADSAADLVVTTEKDAVRLEAEPSRSARYAFLPMRASVVGPGFSRASPSEPVDAFREWLLARLRSGAAA
jgi:tetraacyldisaccharide 4'-kinase